jgi:bifunctional non-homologous end joining protein LigD
MIWDRGSWYPDGDPEQGYRKGHLTFRLAGEKLHGRWHLVRMGQRRNERQDPWLLIKADDDEARSARAPDILEEEPWSVKTKRSMDEIAKGKPPRKRRPRAEGAGKSVAAKRTRPAKGARAKTSLRRPAARAASNVSAHAVRRSRTVARKAIRARPADGAIELTHPDRVYWDDAGITKQDLADYYREVWERMAPHVVGRPLALLRCPNGASGQCFFQKHAHATFNQGHVRRLRDKGEEIIAIEDLNGMLALVQAGVLEVHVWGSTLARIGQCDRMVFDLDPGPGVTLASVIAATKEMHDRLAHLKLKSFVKTTGGKGFHVMVPLAGTPWDEAREFAHALARAVEADAPDRYVSKMTKSKRTGRIFIDYLRNARGATSVAAYSTRARPGAPVSAPVDWSELYARLAPDKFTLRNLRQRLARLREDPWADIGRIRQKLPVK